MITDTKIRILGYIRTNGQARVKDLVEHLGIGNVALHRQLKSLLESGKLTKAGSAPKVFYRLSSDKTAVVKDKEQFKVYTINRNSVHSKTLNEIAKKLKQLGISKEVFGFAVVGSLKGFEVIREV